MSAGLTAAKVAAILGVSADTVRRHWPAWSAEKGFPQPLFGRGLLRWDGEAVNEWKRRRSEAPTAAELEPDWAAIARARGAALDAGRDPNLVSA